MEVTSAFGTLLVWFLCGSCALIALIIALLAFAYFRMKGAKPLKTGVRIWEGIPGSGKSYGVTERIVRVIRYWRRPIYTNVPLKLRVLRRYLKKMGGERMTKYIIPLDEAHFKRFVSRFVALATYCEKRESEGIRRRHAEAEWLEANGEHIYFGVGANMIPYGAVLAIDEIHRWYDQRYQKDEDPALLAMLSMHRHGMYLIELMTQNAMQVSLSFRRQCQEYIRCVDKRNVPFLGFLRWPLPTFFYEVIPADALENQTQRTSAKPIDKFMRLPWLNGGLIWRLYNSFTHCGSARNMRKTVERMREAIEGDDYDSNYERNVKVRRKTRIAIVWGAVKTAAAVFVVWFAYATGAGVAARGADGEAKAATQPATGPVIDGVGVPVVGAGSDRVSFRSSSTRPTTAPSAVVVASELKPAAPLVTAKVGVIAKDWVVIDGKVYIVGERFGSFTLLGADVKLSASLWTGDDGSRVVWSVGSAPVVRMPKERKPGLDAPSTRPAARAEDGDSIATGDDSPREHSAAATRPTTGAFEYQGFDGLGRNAR